ncbi:MAG: hypothetical protein WC365_03920 [Candidatus Babeliales bacterium]|jgi:phage FluMu protein Com
MKIKCNNCGREMSLAELLGYLEVYLLKALASATVAFLIPLLKERFSRPAQATTKGWIDDTMASAANAFHISCPKCKKDYCWDPWPDDQVKEQNKQSQEQSSSSI